MGTLASWSKSNHPDIRFVDCPHRFPLSHDGLMMVVYLYTSDFSYSLFEGLHSQPFFYFCHLQVVGQSGSDASLMTFLLPFLMTQMKTKTVSL